MVSMTLDLVAEASQRLSRYMVDPAVRTRGERPGDGPKIMDVVLRAYASVPYSDRREHLMIERLRATDAYIQTLSVLAEIGDEVVGHVLLTKAYIQSGHSAVATLALAPLSVTPDFQRRGVGKRLIGAAHQRAAELDFGSILVVGIPSYYPQFGYELLSHYPITLPFDAPDENCMILPLAHRALDGVAGVVHYAEGWLEH